MENSERIKSYMRYYVLHNDLLTETDSNTRQLYSDTVERFLGEVQTLQDTTGK